MTMLQIIIIILIIEKKREKLTGLGTFSSDISMFSLINNYLFTIYSQLIDNLLSTIY